ncbi:MAG: ATP-binding protein [Candidatus Sumerlaeaceae bacterium]
MTRKAAAKAPNAADACPQCSGLGYLLTPKGAVPCQCRQQADLQRALVLARIPRKFLGKSLTGFAVKNPRQKEILHFAKDFLKTFRGNEADHPGKGLLMTGKEGTGKTHVAIAILREVIEKGYTGLYWNVPELFLELRRRMDEKSEEKEGELFDHAKRVDLLVLDDLGAERTSEYVLDRLYVLINGRYQNDTATIITTNRTIPELKTQIGPRITSRICEMCMSIEFPEGDYRTRNMK